MNRSSECGYCGQPLGGRVAFKLVGRRFMDDIEYFDDDGFLYCSMDCAEQAFFDIYGALVVETVDPDEEDE